LRDLVEREVIVSRAEIHIVGIRLPDDLHSEEPLIKRARAREVRDAQGHMAKPSM
jgi:hypothetical protein